MADVKTPAPADRWAPVARGDVYCSPGCGLGCKRAAYDAAVADASALADRLGPQWKGTVWENLGWHWKVSAGDVHLHPTTHNGAVVGWMILSDSPAQINFTADTPEGAIAAARDEAQRLRDVMIARVDLLQRRAEALT